MMSLMSDITNKAMTNTYLVIALPNKGAYAPNKFGCLYGDFIKTDIKGQDNPLWIFKSKLYDVSSDADIKEFNDACLTLIPHCHLYKLRAIPMIIKIKNDAAKVATVEEKPEPEVVGSAPKMPKLATPSRGSK